MELLYQNFDKLVISFQGAVPSFIRSQLENAQKEARSVCNQVYAEIGSNNLQVMMHERGARGGYAYQFSTGHDGHIWLIADRDNESLWNIQVHVRSLCLALYGYEKTKQQILDILINDLKAIGEEKNNLIPLERISRVDYCLDFILEEKFNPSFNHFVCTGRAKKSEFGELKYNQITTGSSVETLTVGKMPSKQVTIYNKIKEIKVKFKKYWWNIWKIEEKNFEKEIWRIEIRLGKKELNKWNLRRFADLEKIIGNVIRKTLEDYQLKEPCLKNKNKNRWKTAEIWKKAIKATKSDLFDYSTDVDEKIILNQIREEVINQYEKLISGIFVGYTAATGKDISEIPGVLDHVCGNLLDEVSCNPQKFVQKYAKKRGEFSFCEKEEN